MKVVSGAPNIRPAWFFDTDEQGEGLNDIGTHLVDLVQWTLFPDRAIDYRTDVNVLSAYRWPTMIPEAEFKRVTASAGFPAAWPRGSRVGRWILLQHLCLVCRQGRAYRAQCAVGLGSAGRCGRHPLRGLQRIARASRGAAVEGRQLPDRGVRCGHAAADRAKVLAAVKARVAALQGQWPGVAVDERHGEIHLSIPETFRVGHEAHFAEVTRNFLGYLRNPDVPAWERQNMLAKYYVTTTGTELSHKAPVKVAGRRAP